MSDTFASLRNKIAGAEDLGAVVRTMKAVAASNIGQYEKSVHALLEYSQTIELGLGACFRKKPLASSVVISGNQKKKLKVGKVHRAVVFGSDQGMVGQFNDVIADFAAKTLAVLPGRTEVWAVGERVHARLVSTGVATVGIFNVPISVEAIAPLVGEILLESQARQDHEHAENQISELYLFYNHPTLGSAYEPNSQRVLPLDAAWCAGLANIPWPTHKLPEVLSGGSTTLRAFVREFLFVSLFRACAESLASENASRLAAMQRADKNIQELLEDLNKSFHRVRQSGIDEELFDVIAGFEALRAEEK